jgi:hypothetical protein
VPQGRLIKVISATSEQINRPCGTRPLFSCFQALRARLLSFGPSGTGYTPSMTTDNRSTRLTPGILVFALYIGISFVYFGKVVDFRTNCVGEGIDAFAYIWFLNWWPWAITHGLDPFISHYVWYPEGFNMTWAGSMPVGALAMWPLTASLGPIVSYNVLMLLSPVLSAWTAFMLARYLTRDTVGSLFAGYLYGFSSYQIGHMLGHLNLVLTFVIPLFLLIVVKRFRCEISLFAFIAMLSAALLVQLGLSTEFLATSCFSGAIAWLMFFACAEANDRKRLWKLALEIVLVSVITLILALPFCFLLLNGTANLPSQIHAPSGYSADLLNFLVPSRLNLIGGKIFRNISDRFPGRTVEQGAYLGLPILVVLIFELGKTRRFPFLKPLLLAFVAILILSLGPVLHVAGFETHILLPWQAALSLPLIHQALPARFTIYTALIAGVLVADWLSRTTSSPNRIRRYALAGLGCICLVPNPATLPWAFLPRLAFFTPQIVADNLRNVPNVLVIPYGPAGAGMLWQVQSGMNFTQSGGYIGPTPASASSWPILDSLWNETVNPSFANDLTGFCVAHKVSALLLCPGTSQALVHAVHALHWPATKDHEVEIMRVPEYQSLRFYYVDGDYWPSDEWMGKAVHVVTQGTPVRLSINGQYRPPEPVEIRVVNGVDAKLYTIGPNDMQIVDIPANASVTITAASTFRVSDRGEYRSLSVHLKVETE